MKLTAELAFELLGAFVHFAERGQMANKDGVIKTLIDELHAWLQILLQVVHLDQRLLVEQMVTDFRHYVQNSV